MMKHHVIRFGEDNKIVGEATNEAEARALFTTVHNVDFYNAEEGPRVCHYEMDGKGCFVVDGETK